MKLETEVFPAVEGEKGVQAELEKEGWDTFNLHACSSYPLYGADDDFEEKAVNMLLEKSDNRYLIDREVVDEIKGTGLPDILGIKNGKLKFFEVKSFGDGLRKSQFKWLREHPEFEFKMIITG